MSNQNQNPRIPNCNNDNNPTKHAAASNRPSQIIIPNPNYFVVASPPPPELFNYIPGRYMHYPQNVFQVPRLFHNLSRVSNPVTLPPANLQNQQIFPQQLRPVSENQSNTLVSDSHSGQLRMETALQRHINAAIPSSSPTHYLNQQPTVTPSFHQHSPHHQLGVTPGQNTVYHQFRSRFNVLSSNENVTTSAVSNPLLQNGPHLMNPLHHIRTSYPAWSSATGNDTWNHDDYFAKRMQARYVQNVQQTLPPGCRPTTNRRMWSEAQRSVPLACNEALMWANNPFSYVDSPPNLSLNLDIYSRTMPSPKPNSNPWTYQQSMALAASCFGQEWSSSNLNSRMHNNGDSINANMPTDFL